MDFINNLKDDHSASVTNSEENNSHSEENSEKTNMTD